MAEVLFNKVFIFIFVFYIHFESFFFLCYSPIILLNKVLRVFKTYQTSQYFVGQHINLLYFVIIIISCFFLKTGASNLIALLTLTSIFICKVSNSLDRFSSSIISNNIIYMVLPSFVVFLYILFFVDSLLTLFFFIEVYGVLYYFCFLTSYSFTNQTILKYKNGLLLLLWNNFLTTFFIALGCFLLAKESGSTNFTELQYLCANTFGVYCFLLGLFWKLGLPLFHFFKLEVYKYLLKENVFLFSIITTLINVILIYICFTQSIFFTTIYSHNFIVLSAMFAINLALVNLKLVNFLQFFAFSGVFTITTVLSIFLI